MKTIKTTYKVIDLIYSEQEGNVAFVGTYQECVDFVEAQGDIGYEIAPL